MKPNGRVIILSSIVLHHKWNKIDRIEEKVVKQNYRQISNIRYTKSQNLNVSRLVLQLSLYGLLKSGVKSRMKM